MPQETVDPGHATGLSKAKKPDPSGMEPGSATASLQQRAHAAIDGYTASNVILYCASCARRSVRTEQELSALR